MPKDAGSASLGRLIAKAKALYDLYGAVVYAALWLDGEIKKRRRRKRERREDRER